MSIITYDPDNWLVSLHESLESMIRSVFTDDIYDVQFGGIDIQTLAEGFKTPLPKCLVTVEQDASDAPDLGFGNPGVEVVDEIDGNVVLHEAQWHTVTFDFGVWASAEAGGQTACLRAYQKLSMLFTGGGAHERFRAATDGIDIRDFSGGRFFLDRLNDLPVWRVFDCRLVVRVFSRYIPPAGSELPWIDGFEQDQELVDADGLNA